MFKAINTAKQPFRINNTHTPTVCAGQNLKSSMNTEADRPIIRCTLHSASPPPKGSRCENSVTFTQAGSMTWPTNKKHSPHKEFR